ncbi:MAG: ATP-binding protein [Chloroflexi bacterium]|nr:ATP-binding protein [Chloroflexota bacterium]
MVVRRLLAGWLQSAGWPAWVGYLSALAAVALMSLIVAFVVSVAPVSITSMLYLIVVLAAAIAFGRGPAVLASIAAFLAFDWFFVLPLHTFTIAAPAEWVSLLLFLITAIITGQLAGELRRRAREAEQREREAVVLYDVVRLISQPDTAAALRAVAERLRHELALAAVSIELADSEQIAEPAVSGEAEALQLIRSAGRAAKRQLSEGPPPTGQKRGEPGRWIHVVPPHPPGKQVPSSSQMLLVVPIRFQGTDVGDLMLVRRSGSPNFTSAEDRLLSAVTTQLGLWVERVRLQRQATDAEVLRRTDDLKTALLNAVSHDLRTPLSSIIASAGSLRQCDVEWTGEEREEFAKAIEEEAQRLNQIVGNLLDLSRIEGGNLRPQKAWYDMGALVDDVLGHLRPLLARHKISVSIPEDLPPVYLDYVEIDQVFSNLLENAAKYTPAGTEIDISARTTDGEIQVEVADRGPGIPPANLPFVFEPFYRVSEKSSLQKGTGLGLAVAKGLVEAHGGRIWAESRQGGGERFIFSLPLEPSGEPAESSRKK